MPNDCASFDQAGNPRSSASMPRSALGDKDRGSRRDKNWSARPPSNIKSGPTNPAILTTYEGMHYDAVSSIAAMIVLCCLGIPTKPDADSDLKPDGIPI